MFDFLVPKNLDSTLLKLCELFLPSAPFSGLHDGLTLQTTSQRKKIHNNMLCYRQKWVVHWSFKIWAFTCCLKLSVELHWTKIFRARFSCISVNLSSTAVTFVSLSNGWWSRQLSPTTLTLNGFIGVNPRGWRLGRSPPLKPAKVTLFTMILYNTEKSIRDIRSFCLALFCQSSFSKNTLSLLQYLIEPVMRPDCQLLLISLLLPLLAGSVPYLKGMQSIV